MRQVVEQDERKSIRFCHSSLLVCYPLLRHPHWLTGEYAQRPFHGLLIVQPIIDPSLFARHCIILDKKKVAAIYPPVTARQHDIFNFTRRVGFIVFSRAHHRMFPRQFIQPVSPYISQHDKNWGILYGMSFNRLKKPGSNYFSPSQSCLNGKSVAVVKPTGIPIELGYNFFDGNGNYQPKYQPRYNSITFCRKIRL